MYYSWAQGFITASNALLHQSADGLSMVTNLTSKITEDKQQALLEDPQREIAMRRNFRQQIHRQ